MDFVLHSPVFRGISYFKHRKAEHCLKWENEDDAQQSDTVSDFPCGGRINGCKYYLVFILFRDNLTTTRRLKVLPISERNMVLPGLKGESE